MNKVYAASVASDLYQAGYACDGHPFIAEQFYVVIENEAGRCIRHVATFNGTEQVICEETGDACFPDFREEASAKSERLSSRVNAACASGKGIYWTYWGEVDPVYGSDEYISQCTEAKRLFAEKAEA